MFRKAERKKAKLRLGICGPAGSGKTYSALLIAQGIGGKIALLDTEHGSGELYSEMVNYDVAPLSPPFTPQKYIDTINEAENAGYTTLIIDSLTHAWTGEGGLLDMHDKAATASRSKNSFAAWREVTPHHTALVEAMLQSSIHIIATMRTKTAYEMVEENGKTKPVKIGLTPVQREGMDYEFSVVFDISIDKHISTVSKDRTSLFDGKYFVPSAETGTTLLDWLEKGIDPAKQSQADLEAFLAEMGRVTNVFDLQNWWNQNKAQISALQKEYKDKLIEAKERFKNQFLRNNSNTGKNVAVAG